MTELLLMRQAQLTAERGWQQPYVCVGGEVGMSTPPHATPKRIMLNEADPVDCGVGVTAAVCVCGWGWGCRLLPMQLLNVLCILNGLTVFVGWVQGYS